MSNRETHQNQLFRANTSGFEESTFSDKKYLDGKFPTSSKWVKDWENSRQNSETHFAGIINKAFTTL